MTETRVRAWRSLELIDVTVSYFRNRGVDRPRLNAELLLAHTLGCQRIELYTQFEKDLPAETVDAFRERVRRRGAREPLQHILGRTEFHSAEIRCDSRALVPRQETECVVDEAVRLLRGLGEPLVADIGCGTGCLAIALAKAASSARVIATDISLDALEVAYDNVAAHGLTDRVRLVAGDLCAPLLVEGLAAQFDLVMTNPPYVKSDEIEGLQPEVRDHDPRLALDGGPDGLRFYRRLFDEAPGLMKPGAAMVLELPDQGQAEVKRVAESSGWTQLVLTEDMAGIARVLTARWTS